MDIVCRVQHLFAWYGPGVSSKVWEDRADDGTELPSGVYFYRLKAGDFVATHEMVLLHRVPGLTQRVGAGGSSHPEGVAVAPGCYSAISVSP